MDIPYTNISPTQLLEIYVAFQILSAAVQSMEPPREDSNAFYKFIYRFLSLLVADFKSFTQQKQAKKVNPPATPEQE